MKQILWVVLCLSFVCGTAFGAGARGGALATPPGLEKDVRFWEKVFSRYKKDQCVFHDKDDLGIVYFVKRLPGATPKEQARAGIRYLNAIRGGMQWLASGGKPRNLVERRIYDVTPAELRTPDYFAQATDNVRCQRGVDLSDSLARSTRYVAMIKRQLAARHLPTDLAYLPHLESGFNVRAHSRAGARGLWQLMPATARLSGLRVSRTVDNRTDPARATMVATRILSDLYRNTGSWPLAITAYNYGPNGIRRAIKAHGPDYMRIRERHRTRIFGFAARNYFPSFLAVRNVAMAIERGEEVPGAAPVAERAPVPLARKDASLAF
jgi:membrane-bound lytic murein transglycosylase D